MRLYLATKTNEKVVRDAEKLLPTILVKLSAVSGKVIKEVELLDEVRSKKKLSFQEI